MPEPPAPPPAPDLAAIEARAAAATEGPWLALEYWDLYAVTSLRGKPILPVAESANRARGCSEEDADFIAAARTDVPALVAYARALEAENARLRAGIAGLYINHAPSCTQYACTCGALIHNDAVDALLGDEIPEDTPETLARRIEWARKSIGW